MAKSQSPEFIRWGVELNPQLPRGAGLLAVPHDASVAFVSIEEVDQLDLLADVDPLRSDRQASRRAGVDGFRFDRQGAPMLGPSNRDGAPAN